MRDCSLFLLVYLINGDNRSDSSYTKNFLSKQSINQNEPFKDGNMEISKKKIWQV